jgi:soluble P-type ATPase
MEPTPPGLAVDIPGWGARTFTHLLLDFTGTLSCDGVLLPGVAERLRQLARSLQITVLTADTFGTACGALADLPVRVQLITTGEDKARFLAQLTGCVVAIGNGVNDEAMLKASALGIATIGPEGAAGRLLAVADVVVRDIVDALDLLLHPLRLKATLRV